MKDSKAIIDHVARETFHSKKGSPIEAGPTNKKNDTDLIDTINQIFTLFSINYHNQFHSAFKDEHTEIQAKKLWLESLHDFSQKALLLAAKKSIKESTYLPTINQIIVLCREFEGDSLPDTHAAYVEACRAPSPKTHYNWSHPAIYYAGKESDWFFLANNTEQKALPIFRARYEKICERVRGGEELLPVQQLALPETSEISLSKKENIQRMENLRKQLDI